MGTLPINIGDRRIGPANPCFLVAEAGVNHNGDPEAALRLVDAAADAGADAIKFQTFTVDRLTTKMAPKADYQKWTTDPMESQYEMLQRLELSEAAHRRLVERCRLRGVLFLSTPFDEASADFLERLAVPAFKVPSGELTNLPLVAHIAAKGRPMIVSTGMADLGEVEAAVRTVRATGNDQIVLLHCVSSYPAEAASVNLRAMATLASAFGVPVGYSDHTQGPAVALAAVALGACVLEKHFTLDCRLLGPDHAASTEPEDLAALIRAVRQVEASLGDGRKLPAVEERTTALAARRSLVAACDIAPGSVLTEAMVALRRPGTGLPPAMRPYVVGRTARTAIPAGTPISLGALV